MSMSNLNYFSIILKFNFSSTFEVIETENNNPISGYVNENNNSASS